MVNPLIQVVIFVLFLVQTNWTEEAGGQGQASKQASKGNSVVLFYGTLIGHISIPKFVRPSRGLATNGSACCVEVFVMIRRARKR